MTLVVNSSSSSISYSSSSSSSSSSSISIKRSNVYYYSRRSIDSTLVYNYQSHLARDDSRILKNRNLSRTTYLSIYMTSMKDVKNCPIDRGSRVVVHIRPY